MLVLSRQRDETIMIGDNIEITVVDIRGDKIRLGIDAPTDVAVHRKEVYESIRRENERAVNLELKELKQFRFTQPQSDKSDADSKGSQHPLASSNRTSGAPVLKAGRVATKKRSSDHSQSKTA